MKFYMCSIDQCDFIKKNIAIEPAAQHIPIYTYTYIYVCVCV